MKQVKTELANEQSCLGGGWWGAAAIQDFGFQGKAKDGLCYDGELKLKLRSPHKIGKAKLSVGGTYLPTSKRMKQIRK